MGTSIPASQRREELLQLTAKMRGCERCPQLANARSTVVVGVGDADAELMFVTGAPTRNEDRQGLPLVGPAGELFSGLLDGIGLRASQVYVSSVVGCLTPDNRDPLAEEVGNCNRYLSSEVELVAPKLICTLGTLPTRSVLARPLQIRQIRGEVHEQQFANRSVRVLPMFSPAAALYAKATEDRLREDFQLITELLQLPELPEPEPEPIAAAAGASEPISASDGGAEQADQLGLF